MSNLSKEQRDKLPASAFALPQQRLYPILDQDDVDSAAKLIGKHPNAKSGVIRLAKAKGLKIPDAWKDGDATMSVSADTDLPYVIKRGKVFEAGDYPDKHFSITPEEMQAAVDAFTAAPVKDTHSDSLLAGKLGEVRSIALDGDNPYDLIGEVAIPQWLDDALAGTAISVSAEWDRATKQLTGLALVTDPRVEDAAIFAAFAKATHDTPQGQMAIQRLHDQSAASGAVCNAPASMASKHEASAIQQIHDVTTQHGAQCATVGAPASGSAFGPYFSAGPTREARMSWGDKLRAWFSGGMQGEPPLPDAVTGEPVAFSATGAISGAVLQTAPDPEVATLRAQVQQLTAARIQAEAVGFADGEIAAHRAYPAEREALIAAFAQASYDDGAGAATFSGGKSRIQLLRDAAAARPAHALTTEQLRPEDVTALFNTMQTQRAGEPKAMTADRKAALLGASEIGRDVLASRNGAARN